MNPPTIEDLIRCANSLLSIGVDESEAFVNGLSDYLALFETWQSCVDAGTLRGQRDALIQLNEAHQSVILRSEASKAQIANQLTDIHKRTQALKAYLNRYPSRVTIAGKREG